MLTHKLNATSYSKKDWTVHIKDYMKALLEKIDESRKAKFKESMTALVKTFLGNKEIWEHAQFFVGVCASHSNSCL